MKIVIGTKNPSKIAAVERAFPAANNSFFSLNIPSGVSEQPATDEETIRGAVNRATAAAQEGDIGIGLEGGVQEISLGLCLCNWGALVEKDKPPIIAGGARFLLPEKIAERIRAGEELGPVMDDFFNKQDVRKHEGAVGIFTNGLVDRADMFLHVTKLLVGQYQYRKTMIKENPFG